MCVHMPVNGYPKSRSQECMGQPYSIGSNAIGMHAVLSSVSRQRWLPQQQHSVRMGGVAALCHAHSAAVAAAESLQFLVHGLLLKWHTECREESEMTHSIGKSPQNFQYYPDQLSCMVRAHQSCPSVRDVPRLEGSTWDVLDAGGRSLRLS